MLVRPSSPYLFSRSRQRRVAVLPLDAGGIRRLPVLEQGDGLRDLHGGQTPWPSEELHGLRGRLRRPQGNRKAARGTLFLDVLQPHRRTLRVVVVMMMMPMRVRAPLHASSQAQEWRTRIYTDNQRSKWCGRPLELRSCTGSGWWIEPHSR